MISMIILSRSSFWVRTPAPPRRDPHSHLPLKAVDFHVLLVLTGRELHGYGIVKEIESRSGGRLQLEPGNLYRYIRRLAEEDMIEAGDRRPASDALEERRRYYRVTSFGRQVLAAEADLAAAGDDA
jgi:DNA-binding PadR family transcriptional regulator